MPAIAQAPDSPLPTAPPKHDRHWYLQGDKVRIELCSTEGRSRKLDLRIAERLLCLYTPSMASKLEQTQVAGLKVLHIKCEQWHTIADLEIPALSQLITWMNNFPYNSRTAAVPPLPSTATMEDHILLLRACELLRIDEGVKAASERVSEAMSSDPLSPDDVKLLWYMFGNAPENIETIAFNLAEHNTDQDEYLLWFLEQEVAPDQANALLHQAQHWKVELARDADEAAWRQRQNNSPKKTLKRYLKDKYNEVVALNAEAKREVNYALHVKAPQLLSRSKDGEKEGEKHID